MGVMLVNSTLMTKSVRGRSKPREAISVATIIRTYSDWNWCNTLFRMDCCVDTSECSATLGTPTCFNNSLTSAARSHVDTNSMADCALYCSMVSSYSSAAAVFCFLECECDCCFFLDALVDDDDGCTFTFVPPYANKVRIVPNKYASRTCDGMNIYSCFNPFGMLVVIVVVFVADAAAVFRDDTTSFSLESLISLSDDASSAMSSSSWMTKSSETMNCGNGVVDSLF